jgi:hypothetical protein
MTRMKQQDVPEKLANQEDEEITSWYSNPMVVAAISIVASVLLVSVMWLLGIGVLKLMCVVVSYTIKPYLLIIFGFVVGIVLFKFAETFDPR